jgi:formate dehydrogenase major subunit
MSAPRLTTPLVRSNGKLLAASWNEALDAAAQGLTASIAAHGAKSVGIFSCSKATNEVNYAAQKFLRAAVGSNNIDSCNRT